MAPIILIILVVRALMWLIPGLEQYLVRLYNNMKRKIRKQQPVTVFDSYYVEVKAFYLTEFNMVPSVSFIGNIDVAKVYTYLDSGAAGKVLGVYQRNIYNWDKQQLGFQYTIFKLANQLVIELGNDYAEVLYAKGGYANSLATINTLASFRAPEKAADFEINIISQSSTGLDLKPLPIKPTTLDLDLYYNDDFKAVDQLIRERLMKENDKGIVLLHGLPGTGKTTYLRHLIGSLQKKVLFVSPAVAGNLMNPEFMDLLIDNPNAVLVIEDAENIIMDRRYSGSSSVSNLLNISDGLLSDCLNVQIICTFNSDINTVDSALLRKGRLIAKYEFGKLSVAKARRLSNILGINKTVENAMTLAEITNQQQADFTAEPVRVLGFSRDRLTAN